MMHKLPSRFFIVKNIGRDESVVPHLLKADDIAGGIVDKSLRARATNLRWVGQNTLPTSNHGNPTDHGPPSGVDARDIFFFRPNFRHLC